MNKFFLLLAINILTTTIVVYAQSSYEYEWREKGVYESISDTIKNEDAIMIYQKKETNLLFSYDDLSITTTEKIHQKIKFLTQKGIEKYSRIYLPVNYEENLQVIDARTIKNDGSVIDLKSSDLKKLNIADRYDVNRKLKLLIFSIPGIEINDEVEVFIKYSGRGIMTSNEVFLNTFLPTLQSSFTMNISIGIGTEIKTYNQMPKPEIKERNDIVTYTWIQNNLSATNSGTNDIPSKTLPYLRFAVRDITARFQGIKQTQKIEPNSWLFFVDMVLFIAEPPNYWGRPKVQYLNTFLDEQLKNPAQNTKLEKLVGVHNYINDSVEVKRLKEEESNNPLGYHLYNKKIDTKNLVYLYSKIFEELGLNYFLGIGKSKFTGDIDLEFVSRSQLTHYFFAVEIENNLYFLFLKDEENFYNLGEIPVELQGTDAVLISRKNIPDRIKKITLQVNDKSINYYRKRTIVNVNTQSDSLLFNIKETFSGAVSTVYRQTIIKNNHELLEKAKEYYVNKQTSITLDSISIGNVQHSYPYVFTVNSKAHATTLNNADKKLLSVSIKDWLNHHCAIPEPYKRDLDYHSDFNYSDNIKYYFTFDRAIEVVNKEANEIKIQNDYGSYSFTITPVNEKTILIDSNYEINKEMLEKEKYNQITELYDAFQKANNTQLIFKIKE